MEIIQFKVVINYYKQSCFYITAPYLFYVRNYAFACSALLSVILVTNVIAK